ncbi:7-carboxy-7-deazaguanine synthase [Amphibiibacter pelophylacis]|uniref:7-carboxy-7-deazaguanine synthase n=1 Tax=Amphibiibacter pelophylacis TaxID=1799477 RepID=A0ACC6P3R7_9BURK
MSYAVKEIFYTLQGEGQQAGRPAVFCRFAGCNLWSGREEDRASAQCRFCDTDFVGMDGTLGGRYDADALADTIARCWPVPDAKAGEGGLLPGRPLVVMTGGEPLLQLDAELIAAVHARGFEIAVESNGTLAAPPGIDWLCVSPKAGNDLVQRSGHELKVVVPQAGFDEAALLAFEALDFASLRVQPMDSPTLPGAQANNQAWAVQWCLDHPRWSLSVQTHKVLLIR